jgi:hypothetical protein
MDGAFGELDSGTARLAKVTVPILVRKFEIFQHQKILIQLKPQRKGE